MVAEDLQWDFSLHHALSLYLVETLERLDPESETYALDLLTLVESILEDPDVVLRKQVDKLKQELAGAAQGRGRASTRSGWSSSNEVTHPQPLADFLYGTFHRFRGDHPWVGGEDIQPEVDRPRDVRGLHELRRLREALRPAAERGRPAALPLAALQDARPERARAGEDRGGLGRPGLLPHPAPAHRHQPARGVGEPAPPRAPARAASGEKDAIEATCGSTSCSRDPKVFAARVRAEMHLARPRPREPRTGRRPPPPSARTRTIPRDLWDAERFERRWRPSSPSTASSSSPPRPAATSGPRSARPATAPGRSPRPCSIPRATTSGPSRGRSTCPIRDVIDGPLVRLERIGP